MTEIAAAPNTAPQIPGFKLGYLFIWLCFRVRGKRCPPDLAAADCGPERELVRYPTGYLGLRRINHTRFRGTEFCAADQFSEFLYCVIFIFCKCKRCSFLFLNNFDRRSILITNQRFLRRALPGSGQRGGRCLCPACCCFAKIGPPRKTTPKSCVCIRVSGVLGVLGL